MKTSNTTRINTLASILVTGALLWGIALPAQAADAADFAPRWQILKTALATRITLSAWTRRRPRRCRIWMP
jgi:hypothetical protein